MAQTFPPGSPNYELNRMRLAVPSVKLTGGPGRSDGPEITRGATGNVDVPGLDILGTPIFSAAPTPGVAAASTAPVLSSTRSLVGVTLPVVELTADATLLNTAAGTFYTLNKLASLTVTLPSAAAVGAGVHLRFAAKVAPTSGAGYTIHPAGADQVRGNAFTPANSKGAVATQATAKVGDSLSAISDGVSAWYITVGGTWAREA